MDDLRQRIASLSPEKRALFDQLLMQRTAAGMKEQAIPRREASTPCPLSFAQQRLWFLDQFEPDSPLYNVAKAFMVHGPLDESALRRALEAIIVRHEVLRTTFNTVDGEPVQVIGEPRAVPLSIIELSTLPDAQREVELHRRLTGEVRRPFDLAHDVMLRSALYRLGPEEHVLLLTMHHIASDAWSMGALLRELGSLYRAFATHEPPSLPALPIQYADYAVWQRHRLQGEILEHQLTYWRQQLGDAPPVLELPTDRPRPAVQSYEGSRHPLVVPPSVTDGLKDLSRQEGATLFMTLLAAWQLLLHRYTGQAEISVGSPIAGRTRVETEPLIGFFVNTIVLHTHMSGNPTFRELLQRVRQVAMGAYAHQDIPFEKLVGELQPDRTLSYSPLFQVFFAFLNVPRLPLDLAGLVVSPLDVQIGTAKFDLSLYLWEAEGGLRGTVEYNTDLFDQATIARLAAHFSTLLAGITATPERRVAEAPVLTPAERHQVLEEWNATWADYPRQACLHELIKAQAEQTPERVAVVYDGASLSYRQLNARANRLARYLQRQGVGPESLVGICMERGLDMVVGLLGIMKAGGTYLPLDPSYPPERLGFMLEDAQARIVLTQHAVKDVLPRHQAQVICLDTDWERIASESEATPVSGVISSNLAYVIYTSGSTGKPKGVQIPHHAVVNFLEAMHRQLGITADDTLLAVTTLSFDIAGLELFLPLIVGGRVVLVNRAVAADGGPLRQQLAESSASVMQATPATWRILLEAGWPGSDYLRILCGGESLPSELAAQLLTRGAALWNLYGPTETTIWSTVCRIPPQPDVISIGQPIANTQIYIRDGYGHPAPVGVSGELYIGGDGVARGYLNQPELTAERFVPDPYGAEPGARVYRTGDVARRRADGRLELLGRSDQQVKVRGFRIELGEIEAALARHPGIAQAVTVVREDSPGDRRLVAYVVAHASAALTAAELRRFLRQSLPDYMLPAIFMMVDAVPLTPNGKVDRRALPSPEKSRLEVGNSQVAPRDAIELQLIKIWEEVLRVEPVGVRDNFFELGGDSLLAVRLFAQIDKPFGRKLPLATLFQAPTIEHLADVLRQEECSPPWSALVPIQPRGSKPPFFCVHAHGGEVLIFKDLVKQLGPDQPFYGLQALWLNGEQARPSGVEEMAASYLREIRTLQPKGPYLLGGYCYGGKVAFEMAQQLKAEGQEVALLAMLDAYAPGYPQRLPWVRRQIGQRVAYHVGNLRRRGPHEWLNYCLEKGKIVKARTEKRLMKFASKLYLGFGRPLPTALQEVQDIPRPRHNPYTPSVYPGEIVLFRPSQQPQSYYHLPDMGWGGLAAGGLEIYEVPGRFGAIIKEPHVRVMAEHLRRCLQAAQTTATRVVGNGDRGDERA
jgi:amino acid adenylation domain-containing protein